VKKFWDLLYFNFTTILTVGYGDYVPVSFGRFLSIAEAIFGLVLFGAIISVATIKAMLPPKNAVAFSKYGYYCTDEQTFLVIFVNTTSSFLVNPEMCSYYRQDDRWVVRPSYRAPFIGHSVWTDRFCRTRRTQLSRRGGREGALKMLCIMSPAGFTPESNVTPFLIL
jgi:hypothetical protein